MESSFSKEDNQRDDSVPLFHNVKGIARCRSQDESSGLLQYDVLLRSGDSKYGAVQDEFGQSKKDSLLGSYSQSLTDSYRLKFMSTSQIDPSVTFNERDCKTWLKEKFYQLKQFSTSESYKNMRRNIKIAVLFLATLISSIIFAVQGDLRVYQHQFSVSRRISQRINITGISKAYPVVNVRLFGSFLLEYPSINTQNITITLTNPVTGTLKSKKYAYTERSDIAAQLPERRVSSRFDFSDEVVEDYVMFEMHSDTLYSVPVSMQYFFLATNFYNGAIYGTFVLIGVYGLIMFELIHRTLAAMIGALAGLAVLAAVNVKASIEVVLTWLDYDTLCLLFGMMVIVAVFCETGFFDWLALQCYKLAKGRTWPLITLLCVVCAVMSAFLDNVTTILLLTPVTIRLCEVMDLDAKHILIAEILFSNIGGTATAIGDPPNVLIVSDTSIERASNGKINFASFTLHMTVGTVFVALSAYALLRLIYRKVELLKSTDPHEIAQLKIEIGIWKRSANKIAIASREDDLVKMMLIEKAKSLEVELEHKQQQMSGMLRIDTFKQQLTELEKTYIIRDYVLLVKCAAVLGAVIICFFLNSFIEHLNISIGWTAMFGAIWLLVLSDYADLDSILHRIEWATLLFFAALFVLMEALTELQLIQWVADQAKNLIKLVDEDAQLAVAIIIIIWMSAIVSSFIDNIPFTTAMIPVIVELASDPTLNFKIDPLVWALAFGACLGGNGTLIGASCNVVCAGLAENHGHGFTFGQFFKIGFPTMLVTVFIAMCYLLICHVALDWHV